MSQLIKPYRLSEALNLLEFINTEARFQGRPLYEVSTLEGIALWSFLQTRFFENVLKPFTRQYGVVRDPHMNSHVFNPQNHSKLHDTRPVTHFQHGPWKSSVVRLLRPLLAGTWMRRARRDRCRVLVYTSDLVSYPEYACDFRFKKVYTYLTNRKIPFAEIFHIADSYLAFRNAIKRRRLPMYLEMWTGRAETGTVDLPLTSSDQTPWLARQICSYFRGCGDARARVEGLRGLLRAGGFKALVSMDDFRSNQELLLACKLEGVRSILIQHGLLTRYHAGWVCPGIPQNRLVKPDHFLVHAPFWKRVLESSGSHLADSAQVVSGFDKEDTKPNALVDNRFGDKAINVLLLYESLWDPAEARKFVRCLIGDARFRILFKIRPDLSEERQIREYFDEGRPHMLIRDLETAKSMTDVILGSHSSLMYKLLGWHKPVFRMATSFEFGEQLFRLGLAENLKLEDDFHRRFKEALSQDSGIFEERWHRFRGLETAPDYREVLDKLLEEYL